MPDTSQVTNLEVACNGGLILDKISQAIPAGAATILQNFEPSILGGYRRINGFSEFDANALTGADQVLGIAFLGSNVIVLDVTILMYMTGMVQKSWSWHLVMQVQIMLLLGMVLLICF